MPDRENVIKTLEKIKAQTKEIGLDKAVLAHKFMDEIMNLLKEQEPILLENQHKPYGNSTNANSPWISRCPKCGKKVEGKQTRFCKYCGQAVKWERANRKERDKNE